MSVREFYVHTSDGTRIDLNSPNFMVYEPSGLGISIDNELVTNNTMIYASSQEYDMEDITLKIAFLDYERTPYENFLYFTKKLVGGAITLEYVVPDVGTYYRDCLISKITKTDLDGKEALLETLTLQPISLWYEILELTENLFSESKTLDFTVDTGNLLPVKYKNEIMIFNDMDDYSLDAPYWEFTHDYTHPGQDGYNVSIPKSELFYNDDNVLSERRYFLKAGNLNAVTYAYVGHQVRERQGTSWLLVGESIDTNVLNREFPYAKNPICVMDGDNSITITLPKTEAHESQGSLKITIKMEYSLV